MKSLNSFTAWSHSDVDKIKSKPEGSQTYTWKMDQEARTYRYHKNGPMFTIQTSTYPFYVSLYTNMLTICFDLTTSCRRRLLLL